MCIQQLDEEEFSINPPSQETLKNGLFFSSKISQVYFIFFYMSIIEGYIRIDLKFKGKILYLLLKFYLILPGFNKIKESFIFKGYFIKLF